MPKLNWDARTCDLFPNMKSTLPFRLWVYREAFLTGYPYIAKALTKALGEEFTEASLKSATAPIAKGQLRPCRECNNLSTQDRCSACIKAARDGRLTDRLRQRIDEHYRMAAEVYGSGRDRETTYITDEYCQG